MYVFHRFLLMLAAAGVMHLSASRAAAQFDIFWTVSPPTAADWNVDGNWSEGLVPSFEFQEIGVINNGGSAFVDDAPPNVGGITLGRVAGGSGDNSGTLEIRSGGSLTAVSGINNTGAVIVGQDATGTLNILDGGQLEAASVQSSGAGSSINLSGTAQLISNGTMNLNALVDISGQSANLSAATAMSFGNNSTLRVEIDGGAAPLLKAGTGAILGGTLELDFAGATPTPGDSWNLFDAGGIGGQFAQVNLASGSIGTGQRFRVRAMPDQSSTNGVYGQLVLEQLLVLEINRDTGGMQIVNPAASNDVAIDTYAITSSHGSFNPANGAWSSLTDQAESGWIEANPKATLLAELNTSGEQTIVGNSQLSLGTPWDPQFSQIGEDLEDVVFRYTTPDGEIVTAPVVYSGANVNDVTLFVDPDTGQAQLRNASPFSIDVEGYTIRSESMSLDPSVWNSLQDNSGASDWLEANPTEGAVSEFKTAGVESLTSHRSFDLGELFDVAGTQDLVLEYLVAGQSQPSIGRVLYQEISPAPEGVVGDYNGDNVVNAADYVVWRDSLGASVTLPNEDPDVTAGQVTAEDYAVWRTNFGNTAIGAGAGAVAGAVPEPGTLGSMVLASFLGIAACRRRQHPSGY